MSIEFNYKKGDIVNAEGQIAVILDVMRSDSIDDLNLKVRFVRNLGDSRPYDILDLTPTRAKVLGVDQWEPATLPDLEKAIESRLKYLAEIEAAQLLAIITTV